MSRLNRDRPLPDLQRVRVTDQEVQRGFDSISNTLRAVLEFLQPLVQREQWRPLPFYSDWGAVAVTVTEPQFTKERTQVELAGGATTVAGTSGTIAVLPEGYRPQRARTFAVGIYNAGRTTGTVDITADGRVLLVSPAVAANIEVYLDGVKFDTRV